MITQTAITKNIPTPIPAWKISIIALHELVSITIMDNKMRVNPFNFFIKIILVMIYRNKI